MNAIALKYVEWDESETANVTIAALRSASQQHMGERHYTLTESQVQTPDWVIPVVSRLVELMRLPDNWDSYGAKPIDATTVRYFLEALIGLMRTNTPAPDVVPSPEGHLQAEWHLRGIDLEVEMISASRISVAFRDSRGLPAWSDELRTDLSKLTQAIKELSQRV
jgi:hypothetical protein